MSRKKRPGDDPPSLFDLPLHEHPGEEDTETTETSRDETESEDAADPTPEELFPAEPAPGGDGTQSSLFGEGGDATASGLHRRPGTDEIDAAELAEIEQIELDDRVLVRHRLLGGFFDLLVHAVVLALLLGATWMLGTWSPEVPPRADQWVALGLFLLLFSFLYTVIPLAFWGRTPGMSRVHHAARAEDGEPLTFGQTVRRWLAALFTLALGGLPLVLALGERRSPADRLSASETHVE